MYVDFISRLIFFLFVKVWEKKDLYIVFWFQMNFLNLNKNDSKKREAFFKKEIASYIFNGK